MDEEIKEAIELDENDLSEEIKEELSNGKGDEE